MSIAADTEVALNTFGCVGWCVSATVTPKTSKRRDNPRVDRASWCGEDAHESLTPSPFPRPFDPTQFTPLDKAR